MIKKEQEREELHRAIWAIACVTGNENVETIEHRIDVRKEVVKNKIDTTKP